MVVLAMLCMVFLAFGIIFYVLLYQKKFLAQKNEARERELIHQKEITKTVLESEERERHRIAVNLHDELGALLNTTRMTIASMESRMGEEDLLLKKTRNAHQLTLQAIESVRLISQDLSSPVLQRFGLIRALNELVISMKNAGSMEVSFYSSVRELNFSKNTEVQLYRILKELLTNVLKYADAEFMSVELNCNGRLEIRIIHSGNGLVQEEFLQRARDSRGHGLNSVLTRVNSLGAELVFSRLEEDQDYLIFLALPYETID